MVEAGFYSESLGPAIDIVDLFSWIFTSVTSAADFSLFLMDDIVSNCLDV